MTTDAGLGGVVVSVATHGLCPAGQATLEAHDKRLEQLEERNKEMNAKLDGNTKLLIATLVGVTLNLAYMMIGR